MKTNKQTKWFQAKDDKRPLGSLWYLLVFVLLLSTQSMLGQNKTITGTVYDEVNAPMPGISVVLENSQTGAITDFDGNYQINVPSQGQAVLQFSYIGYLSQSITIGNKTVVDVTMVTDVTSLDEVVVIGYGSSLKKDLTGSISSVKSEEIVKRPIVRLESALQGTTPGVWVTSKNGQPGRGLDVKIRGTNSITGGTGPLYVVDGFIGADTQGISANEIESIEILKDASATAIYGSRGSNGVILITTKSGKEGKLSVNFGSWVSHGKYNNTIDLLNAADFATVVNATNLSSGTPDSFTAAEIEAFRNNGGTDWQKELQQTAVVQNYDLSLSGGSANVKYRFSINHLDQPGTLINQWYKRTVFRSNADFKLNDEISLKVNLTGYQSSSRNNNFGGLGSPFSQANIWDPTSPLFDNNGDYIKTSGYASIGFNPVAEMNNTENDSKNKNFSATTIFTWKLTDNLSFTTTNAYSTWANHGADFRGLLTDSGNINGSARASRNTSEGYTFLNSNYFVYRNSFGNHSINLTALYEQQESEGISFNANALDLSTESLGYYNLGLGGTQQTSSSYSADALQSYMGRLNYSFNDKYLFTASYRYDGSSRLTDKYSGFPSVAVAWKISNEEFLKNSENIDELKIRASYGETGNQAVGSYSSIARINISDPYYFDGTTPTVSTPLGAPAPQDLRWEVSKQTDIGLDISLYNRRLTFTADWYNKDITDLLYSQQAPFYIGGQSFQTNLGDLNNTGFEFSLGGAPIDNDKFKWNSSFNISFNKNKVVSLGDLDNIRIGDVSLLTVGKPLGELVGYEFLGTWKTSEAAEAATFGMVPGDAKFTDTNNDQVYNSDDFVSLGNGTPDFSYGFTNDFSLGNWSASVMIQGVSGNEIYSRTQAYIWGGQGQARHPTTVDALNMWTPSNETENPHYSATSKNFLESSRYVYDGSYLRLKNLLIAYHLPENLLAKLNMSSIEIYASGQNLFTITDYPGYDPEVADSNALTQGVEWASVPNSTTYTLGLRVGF